MKCLSVSIAMLVCSAALTQGQELAADGEFYLISRTTDGFFHGSHKIFQRPSDGLFAVTYCRRPYWVRPRTVAWTQYEYENHRNVQLEFSQGDGWQPICARPERQVTLTDLGFDSPPADPEEEAAAEKIRQERLISRFSAIGSSFGQ